MKFFNKWPKSALAAVICTTITAIASLAVAVITKGDKSSGIPTINLITNITGERYYSSDELNPLPSSANKFDRLQQTLETYNRRLTAAETQVFMLREIVMRSVATVRVIAPPNKVRYVTDFFPEKDFVISTVTGESHDRMPAAYDPNAPVTFEIKRR